MLISVAVTVCLSVCAGVSMLEDKDLSSALCLCCGGQQELCPPIDIRFSEWLLEPQTAEVFLMEDTLQEERCDSERSNDSAVPARS